jgi:hypothetical protein
MVYMPETAIAMTLGLLLIICVFVAHTMLSRRSDSRLGFLLDFMRDAEEQSGRPSSVGSSPCPAENTGTEKFLEATTPVGREAKQHVSQRSWWEEPLLAHAASTAGFVKRGREISEEWPRTWPRRASLMMQPIRVAASVAPLSFQVS